MNAFISASTLRYLKECYANKKFKFIPASKGQDVSRLMPWKEINRIIRQCRLSAPRLRLNKEGQSVPESSYTEYMKKRGPGSFNKVIESKLYEYIKDGATLIIDSIDELSETLDQFCGSMERTFRNNFQVNSYMSWGDNTQGFDTHWDDHDVIILQVYGKKNWFIFEETRKFPLFMDFHEAEEDVPTDPIWNKVIEAGDILFIPRGQWHHAVAVNEPSLHLTMGFSTRTGLNYLDWLRNKLTTVEILRRDVPTLSSPEDLKAYNEELSSAIKNVVDSYTVDMFLTDEEGRMRNRPTLSLPWAIENANFPVTCKIFFNTNVISQYRVENESVKFTALDKNFEFSTLCAPLFEILMDYKHHFFSEIVERCKGSLSEKQLRDFVTTLTRQGLLSIEGELVPPQATTLATG